MAGLDELGMAGLCGFGVGHVAGLSGLGVGHVAAGLSGLGRSRGCCSSYLTGTLMRFGGIVHISSLQSFKIVS